MEAKVLNSGGKCRVDRFRIEFSLRNKDVGGYSCAFSILFS